MMFNVIDILKQNPINKRALEKGQRLWLRTEFGHQENSILVQLRDEAANDQVVWEVDLPLHLIQYINEEFITIILHHCGVLESKRSSLASFLQELDKAKSSLFYDGDPLPPPEQRQTIPANWVTATMPDGMTEIRPGVVFRTNRLRRNNAEGNTANRPDPPTVDVELRPLRVVDDVAQQDGDTDF